MPSCSSNRAPGSGALAFGAPASGALASAALLGGWLALMAPALRWIGGTLGHSDFRLNLVLVLGLGLIVLSRGRATLLALAQSLRAGPRPQALPLALLGGSALSFLAVERLLDIDLVSAFLFGLGSYGLAGLYLPRGPWRRGLPVALMLVGALPFGHQADVYVGFPARVFIAEAVQRLLGFAGVPVDGAGTVLLVMSRAAHVDLPCSGVRSLWAGGLFFLAASWLERRRPSLRWGLAGLGFLGALIIANLARVCALVMLDTVLGWSFAAQLAHAPMGILGFGGACALGWALLRWAPALSDDEGAPRAPASPALGLGLAAALALCVAVYAPRPAPEVLPEPLALSLPASLGLTPMAMTAQEADLFSRHAATDAGKWRLDYQGLTGALILVRSRSWRAHHPPTLCLQGQGFTIEEAHSVLAAPGFPLRHLVLDGGHRLSAFWFQSAERVTDDFADRTWAGVADPQSDWVMVSLLLDPAPPLDDPRAHALTLALRDAVARGISPLASLGDP